MPSHDLVDEFYTVSFDLAAELLECDAQHMEKLVASSRRNARNGISGPLQVAGGGRSLTLLSVLGYRRTNSTI